jgi:large subunit ribosomal protein L3
MKFILGKKIEMSQVFDDDGLVIPVTLVKAGPCIISQIRENFSDNGTVDSDLKLVQVAFGKKNKCNKPIKGHCKKILGFFENKFPRYFKCFKTKEDYKTGQVIDVKVFDKGDKLTVVGWSKGKGFTGVVKRYGFHGQHASHGNKDQLRATGSIGATEPSRVFKGKGMPGRFGNKKITVKNLPIVDIDVDNNILYIKGALPGARNSLLKICCDGKMALKDYKEVRIKKENKQMSGEVDDESIKKMENSVGSHKISKKAKDVNTKDKNFSNKLDDDKVGIEDKEVSSLKKSKRSKELSKDDNEKIDEKEKKEKNHKEVNSDDNQIKQQEKKVITQKKQKKVN